MKFGCFPCLILFVLIFAFFCFPTFAEEVAEPEITADYACVYNVESDKMLYEKGTNTILYPGSLVKIMTTNLALEHYDKVGNATVTVTESALETLRGNNTKLKVGEKLSLYDLIAAVAVGGANDAALVLAEIVGGSVENFVRMMNEKALELGAVNTQFDNPTGFHSPKMYSTLNDLALICKWANTNSEFMKLSSSITYTVPPTDMTKERNFTNANLLLDPNHWLRHYKEGTSGMNAGMTTESGYTLATVYDNDGQTNIVIIVGGKIDGWDYFYFNEAVALIESTSKSFAYRKLVSRDEPVHDLFVLYGKESDRVLLATQSEITAYLPTDAQDSDITYDYKIDAEEIVAPVKKGEQKGEYNVYYQGELVSTVPLVTMNNIKRDAFQYMSGMIKNFFKNQIVRSAVCLSFSFLFFIITLISVIHIQRKKALLRRQREERLARARHARATKRISTTKK